MRAPTTHTFDNDRQSSQQYLLYIFPAAPTSPFLNGAALSDVLNESLPHLLSVVCLKLVVQTVLAQRCQPLLLCGELVAITWIALWQITQPHLPNRKQAICQVVSPRYIHQFYVLAASCPTVLSVPLHSYQHFVSDNLAKTRTHRLRLTP